MSMPSPIDPRSPKDAWDEQHRLLASQPFVWVLQADKLAAAFEVLATDIEGNIEHRTEPSFSNVALMLAGFAIENLLKALIVSKKAPLDFRGRFDIASHNLLKLVTDAGLKTSDDEARLLEKLQEFLIWAGRYPIPLTSEHMRPRTLPSGGFAPITYHHAGTNFDAIRALIKELKQLLPKIKYEEE